MVMRGGLRIHYTPNLQNEDVKSRCEWEGGEQKQVLGTVTAISTQMAIYRLPQTVTSPCDLDVSSPGGFAGIFLVCKGQVLSVEVYHG